MLRKLLYSTCLSLLIVPSINADTEYAPAVTVTGGEVESLSGSGTFIGSDIIKENNYDNLVKWIEDPDTIKIGTRMKNHAAIYTTENKLSDLEIQQIAKYLLSLKPSDDSMATYIKE